VKKNIALFLAVVMFVTCFAGCQYSNKQKPTTPTMPITQNPDDPPKDTNPVGGKNDEIVISDNTDGLGFTLFDSNLISYFSEYKNSENYMVSPISLKMAIALAASGANGDTLDEMLNAIGYSSRDEYLAWASSIIELKNSLLFDAESNADEFHLGDYYVDFSIANGIWHNLDKPGKFTDNYKINVGKIKAMLRETHGDQMHIEINQWVNEQTGGMIPTMFNRPLTEYKNVLVNTVYLKSAWIDSFGKSRTKDGNFTTIDGEIVTKPLMHQTESFLYYEDDDCQVLIMPLAGSFNMAVVIGDNSRIVNKIQSANYEHVNVTLPKFEIDSMFEGEIIDFLNSVGITKAFDPNNADFSNMMDVAVYLDAIIQKTKIEVDEEGLAAAASTAITFGNTSIQIPEKIYNFTADEPFTFYIYAENEEMLDSPELLFYGQYVK
jgi:serpin B